MSLAASHEYLPKADQIAHKFFNKVALLVTHARTTSLPTQPKVEKWFNLETPDSEQFREDLRPYRSLASTVQAVPALELQVLLLVPELMTNQVLVLSDASASRIRIDPTPSHVLLESWVVAFTPGSSSDQAQQEIALASVYKQSISIFRSLFTLLRTLPAWKLCRKLRRPDASNLSIEVRVADRPREETMLKFGAPLSASVSTPLPTSSHAFPPVTYPSGTITISATYLVSPLFHIDTLESLLSSRFLSQDDEGFTPTLAARQTPPMKASLPRSPPGGNIADRFILPANPASATATATAPSPARSRPTSLLNSATGSSQDVTSSSPSTALPIRRPSINAIHPFKSATLSSTPHSHSSASLRQSPLSISGGTGPGLPSRPIPSPTTRIPSSPSRIGLPGSTTASSPRTGGYPPPSPLNSRPPSLLSGSRPSPPVFASSRPSPPILSATGSRPSPPGVASPSSDKPPTGKRFSSSFGHRYTDSAGSAGASGSATSGGRRSDTEKPESASFLTTTTDDDELSAFVQDIDARAPLSTRTSDRERAREASDRTVRARDTDPTSSPRRIADVAWPRIEPESPTHGLPQRVASEDVPSSPIRDQSVIEGSSTLPRRYRDHVDAELKRMNDEFAQSLAGLESLPRRRLGSITAPLRRSATTSESRSSSPLTGSPIHPYPSSSPRRLSSDGRERESPSSAGHTRLPGSPLRGALTLDDSTGSGSALPMPMLGHHRTGSMASGSDEITGRMDMDESLRSARERRSGSGSGSGLGRPFPPR